MYYNINGCIKLNIYGRIYGYMKLINGGVNESISSHQQLHSRMMCQRVIYVFYLGRKIHQINCFIITSVEKS